MIICAKLASIPFDTGLKQICIVEITISLYKILDNRMQQFMIFYIRSLLFCHIHTHLLYNKIQLYRLLLKHKKTMYQQQQTHQQCKKLGHELQQKLKNSIRDLQELEKSNELPPKMHLKLQYLILKINHQPINSQKFSAIAPYELHSLQQIDPQTQIKLFCNIVDCLSGKETIVYFRDEKCFIRKDSFFTRWSSCYINCDSLKITVKNHRKQQPYYKFELKFVRISRACEYFKSKHVFGIIYKDKKFLFGFNSETGCERVHSCIRQIAKENQKKRQMIMNKQEKVNANPSSKQKNENLIQPQLVQRVVNRQSKKASKTRANQSFSLNFQDFENQQEQLTTLRLQVMKKNFIDEQEYILQKNFDHGRILVHKKDSKKTKVVVFFDTNNPQSIIQSYIKMNHWNEEVQSSTIINKLCNNVYILHLKFKKISWFSSQRQAIIMFAAFNVDGAYYMILKSISSQQIFQVRSPIEFEQYVQLRYFSMKEHYLLINVLTSINFNAYGSNQDKRMAINFVKHLDHLRMFCMSQDFCGENSRLFNFRTLKNRERKDSTNLIKLQQQYEHKFYRYTQRESQNLLTQHEQQSKFGELVLKSLQKNSEINEQLIHFVKMLKFHQRYYLQHYFDQKSHIDIHRNQYVVNEKDNFIEQNGDWMISPHGDAIAMNQVQVSLQKNVVKYILKQIGSNIMSGKSIMNMSLPVQMFSGDSLLQRLIGGFSYLPQYLPQAAKKTNPIQQMKLVTLFYIGMSNLYLKILKPFNPILGETFECSFGGIPVYTEQISHHPPICAFYCKTQEFEFHGKFHSQLEMGFNKVYGTNLATHKINFYKTNTHYEIKMLNLQIGGILYGQETYRPSDKCFAYQKTNKLYMEFSAGKQKKKVYETEKKLEPTNLIGGIFKVSNIFTKRFEKCDKKYQFDGVKPEQLVDICCQIRGLWLGDIYFDGIKVKSLFTPLPNRMQYRRFVLPSDSNLRPDIICRRINKVTQSQEQKQLLQDIQRKDQRLRTQRRETKT